MITAFFLKKAQQKREASASLSKMELRGIEPLSEILSPGLSSTTAVEILFPCADPQRQTSA